MSSPAAIPVVLLATADEDYRLAISTALRQFAPEAVLMEVRDGDQFLNWLQLAGDRCDHVNFPVPQLVLLDLDLPGIDALSLLRWLRRDPAFARTHAIVLTPGSRLWRINDAYRAGADSFLSAPIDVDDFRATFEMVQRDVSAQASEPADRPPLNGFSVL